jgi:hypothetical protein
VVLRAYHMLKVFFWLLFPVYREVPSRCGEDAIGCEPILQKETLHDLISDSDLCNPV